MEIIEKVGDRIDSGFYVFELENAIREAVKGQSSICYDPHGIGCSWDTARRGEEDRARDDACREVEGSRPVNCNPFQAKKDITPNGCSDFGISGGWGSSYFVSSCNSHDKCYSDLDASRSDCDNMFHRDMEIQCVQERPPGTTLALCNQQAGRISFAVKSVGWAFFAPAQEAAACVAWEERRTTWGCPS